MQSKKSFGLPDFVTIEKDILTCIICFKLAIDGHECSSCATIVCGECFPEIIKSKKCPMCRKENFTFKPSVTIRKIIANIKTTCPLNCGIECKFDEIFSHIKNQHSLDKIDKETFENILNQYHINIFKNDENFAKKFLFHNHELFKCPKGEKFECIGRILFNNLCENKDDFIFSCEQCNFQYNICKCCVENNSTIDFKLNEKYHEHPLKYIDRDNGWSCDGRKLSMGCKSGISLYGQTKGFKRFRCEQCDFDFCEKCLIYAMTNSI